MLKRFNKVSVREESGRKFFNEITNRTDTKLVMDPVFLINENKWRSLVNEKKVKRYIFLYTLCHQQSHSQLLSVRYRIPF